MDIQTTIASPNEEIVNQIEQTMENEQDDWFIDAILNQSQPEFWWVY